MNHQFHTLKGYEIQEHKRVTYAMEDYLEMICRLDTQQDYVRVSDLAAELNVKASSASKMLANLKRAGMVEYEKYGFVRPTDKGRELGEYLIYRHNVLKNFLCFINGSEDELEQVEKIEHYMNEQTVHNIERFYNHMTGKSRRF